MYLYCEVVLKVYDLEAGTVRDTIKYPTSNIRNAVSRRFFIIRYPCSIPAAYIHVAYTCSIARLCHQNLRERHVPIGRDRKPVLPVTSKSPCPTEIFIMADFIGLCDEG